MQKIPDYMFQQCSNLEDVEISEGLEKMGIYAFSYCNLLTSIVFPQSLTSIGTYAFSNCTSLSEVFAPWKTPISCGGDAFYNIIKNAILHVLENCEGKYAVATGWKVFTNINVYSPTEISTPFINDKKIDLKGIIFDLGGRRVKNMKKGEIYIIDGNKIRM